MYVQGTLVTLALSLGFCLRAEPKIHVVIFDYADVRESTLQMSTAFARSVFLAAGVETDWRVCHVSRNPSENCTLPEFGTYLEAKILPVAAGNFNSPDSLGVALRSRDEPSAISYVFYKPTKEFADNNGQSISLALGIVISHEIAHLLGIKHSPMGIMKAKLEAVDMRDATTGRLNFTAEDARGLRLGAKRALH